METFLIVSMMFSIILVFWWADNRQAAADEREIAEFREQIKHLPVEKRAELWFSKLRHDADRDLR